MWSRSGTGGSSRGPCRALGDGAPLASGPLPIPVTPGQASSITPSPHEPGCDSLHTGAPDPPAGLSCFRRCSSGPFTCSWPPHGPAGSTTYRHDAGTATVHTLKQHKVYVHTNVTAWVEARWGEHLERSHNITLHLGEAVKLDPPPHGTPFGRWAHCRDGPMYSGHPTALPPLSPRSAPARHRGTSPTHCMPTCRSAAVPRRTRWCWGRRRRSTTSRSAGLHTRLC
uniref:Uncharacterized protein n=1 Tax=Pavo cristatus TaxID=9049 RepID=A0A8C9FGR0_PAVCR